MTRGIARHVGHARSRGWAAVASFAVVLAIVAVVAPQFAASAQADDRAQAPTTTAVPGRQGISATLTTGSGPVVGVRVEVSKDDNAVASGESGPDGTLFIPIDIPGQYDVRLITSTLPDDVRVAPGARDTLRPFVREGAASPVVFRLLSSGESLAGSTSRAERVLNLLASGVRFGLVIALAAVGLSMIFGTTGLTNFAHGEMVTFGAFATWSLNSAFGLHLYLAAILGTALSAAFGGALELGLFGPLRRRRMPELSLMVVSIGLAFVLRYVFAVVYDANPRQFEQFAAQAPTVHLGPIDLRPKDLIVSAIALVALVAVGLFLQRSRIGTAIRAVSDNGDLSESSGINVGRVILVVWVLSGALAGLGGILLGSTDTLAWNMGQRVLLIMFAAVVLGGLGTAYGAMAGGLLVGIVSDLSTYWLDADLKIVVALGALIVVLLFRPSGIFGVRVRTA